MQPQEGFAHSRDVAKRGDTRELPPLVPQTLEQLDRAIVLLGNRSRGEELRLVVLSELVGLVGRYPDPATALQWKSALKSIRNDEIFRVTG